MLGRYQERDLDAPAVESWVDAVELHDDIGEEPATQHPVREVIFALANSALSAPHTRVAAHRMHAELLSAEHEKPLSRSETGEGLG